MHKLLSLPVKETIHLTKSTYSRKPQLTSKTKYVFLKEINYIFQLVGKTY